MLLATENFKNKDKSEFTLTIIFNGNETIAIAENTLTKEIEAFDKVGSFSDLALKQFKFSDVKVLVIDNQFTLVPESIFSEDKASSYLNFSTETLDVCEVKVSKNNQFSLNTVWYLNTDLKNQITQT